jgi:hypothetical protein
VQPVADGCLHTPAPLIVLLGVYPGWRGADSMHPLRPSRYFAPPTNA